MSFFSFLFAKGQRHVSKPCVKEKRIVAIAPKNMLLSRWHATLSVCAAILQPAVRTIARQNARKSTVMTSIDRATVGVIGGGLAGVTACRTPWLLLGCGACSMSVSCIWEGGSGELRWMGTRWALGARTFKQRTQTF